MKKFFIIFITSLLFILGNSLLVMAKREDPGAFLKRMFSEGSQELEKEKSDEGRACVTKKFIQSAINIPEIGLRALGSFAKSFPPQEKKEYIERFAEYFLRSRAVNVLADSSGAGFKEDSRINHDVNNVQLLGKVLGIMSLTGQSSYDVSFSMRWEEAKNKWIIHNLGPKGSSGAVEAYRMEFSGCIREDLEQSAKNLNDYLDCRLKGRNKKDCACKGKQLSARQGDD
jgi:ABC-type transporter MlaC component